MKIKLVDHRSETHEAHWGTCEMCEYSGPFDYVEFKFQADDDSKPYWVQGWFSIPYDGPDYAVEIENVYDFAAWLAEKDFPEDTVIDTELLEDLGYEYEVANFA